MEQSSIRIYRQNILHGAEIEEVLAKLTGEITQIPPMYSAVKVNGRKLYEYARKGIEVERPERKVFIHEIELLDPVQWYEGENSYIPYSGCLR